MIVGVFSPAINWCGGAEWVTLNIISALKEQGHQVIILSDKQLDAKKFEVVFNKKVLVDLQIIFPLSFFPISDYHNLYLDTLRMFMLKSRCDILIDPYSNSMLPVADVSYVHHPLLKLVEMGLSNKRNKFFFLPYQSFLYSHKKNINEKLIFANSKFTARVIQNQIGVEPYVLYPPVSSEIMNHYGKDLGLNRENNVTTISRICSGKNLEIIPHIAKSTVNKNITFTIVGLLDSKIVLESLLKLIKQLKVENRVKIITNVKRIQLRDILLNSKAYLHPTINEHFGVAIVEAMASGCIPIVHDSGGPREFVSKEFRYKTFEEAAERVDRVIENWSPAKAEEISQYSNRFSETNFSKRFISILNSYYPNKS